MSCLTTLGWRKLCLSTLCLAAGALSAAIAHAAPDHPVSIITADVYVNRFKTTMQLRFFVEDLALIQGMEPDGEGFYARSAIDEYFLKHQQYLLQNIHLRDIEGAQLTGKIVEVNDSDLPATGIPSAELMNYSLGMVIEYEYPQPPEVLTISQDVADPDYLFPSEMKVLIKQAGRDAPQATLLKPATPETFRFDWSSTPPDENAPEKDWQAWFDEQREKDLGISSYSSTYSFLYITRYEVRHEILVPLASLTEIPFHNADKAFVEVAEQLAAKPAIEKYFVEGNPIEIDGVAVKPLVERIDFYGADVRDFVRQAEPRRVSVANGRVGVMLRYSTKGVPNEVRLTWNRFSPALTNVEGVVFPFDKAEKVKFARYLAENQYHWKNPGAPPLPNLTAVERQNRPISKPAIYLAIGALFSLVVGFAGLVRRRPTMTIASGIALFALGGLAWQAQRNLWPELFWPRDKIESATASEIFHQLHKNIFRAFDYHADEDVLSALETSVDGPLRRDLYLKIKARLIMQDQGGSRSHIDDVIYLAGQVDEQATKALERGFVFNCQWNLVGSVEHWGHIHQRSIVYTGTFQVEPREKSWKITAMDITHEEPPKVKISVRRL